MKEFLEMKVSIQLLPYGFTNITSEINYLKIEDATLRKGSRIIKIAQECLGMRMHDGVPKKLF